MVIWRRHRLNDRGNGKGRSTLYFDPVKLNGYHQLRILFCRRTHVGDMANHLAVSIRHDDFSVAVNVVHQAQRHFISYLGLLRIDRMS